MIKRVYGLGGSIVQYDQKTLGGEVLNPNQEGFKTGFFGGQEKLKPGFHTRIYGSSLLAVDTNISSTVVPVKVATKNNLPMYMDVILVQKPKDVEKIIKNSPENAEEVLRTLIEAKAKDLIYKKYDIYSVLDNRDEIGRSLGTYASGIIEGWGYEVIDTVVSAMPPEEYQKLMFSLSLIGARKDLAMGEGEINIIQETAKAQADASRIRIVEGAKMDMLERYFAAKAKYNKEMIEIAKENLGEDAVAGLFAIYGQGEGRGNILTDAIGNDFRIRSTGKGVNNAAKKTGLTTREVLWANTLSGSRVFANINLADLDRRSSKDLYGE
jgi:hypothetical protein